MSFVNLSFICIFVFVFRPVIISGAPSFTQSPSDIVQVELGGDIILNWKYKADPPRDSDFESNSPVWIYIDSSGNEHELASEDKSKGWAWEITSGIPPRYKGRISKLSNATGSAGIKIVNATYNDTGKYECRLVRRFGSTVTDTITVTITVPVNGGYSLWSEWTECTATCEGGSQMRNRTCDNPPPSKGGKSCVEQQLGKDISTRKCNEQDCPNDGNWSPWSKWTECTATCGGGSQMRTRTCDNPPPANGGKPCVGKSISKRKCNEHMCPNGPNIVIIIVIIIVVVVLLAVIGLVIWYIKKKMNKDRAEPIPMEDKERNAALLPKNK